MLEILPFFTLYPTFSSNGDVLSFLTYALVFTYQTSRFFSHLISKEAPTHTHTQAEEEVETNYTVIIPTLLPAVAAAVQNFPAL